MTIAIPLIALVVLLVVWAKCCPEITDKRQHYVCRIADPLNTFSWHARGYAIDINIDPERLAALTQSIHEARFAFWRMGEATKKATTEFMFIDLPHDD